MKDYIVGFLMFVVAYLGFKLKKKEIEDLEHELEAQKEQAKAQGFNAKQKQKGAKINESLKNKNDDDLPHRPFTSRV